jgi:hypothetical protein
MKKTLVYGVAAVAAILLIPTDMFAQTTADFGSQDFVTQSDSIKNFLFGPAMRVVGIVGGAVGVINSVLSTSIKPLLVYGGIGLGINLVPKFIDGVFNVSGLLIQ